MQPFESFATWKPFQGNVFSFHKREALSLLPIMMLLIGWGANSLDYLEPDILICCHDGEGGGVNFMENKETINHIMFL